STLQPTWRSSVPVICPLIFKPGPSHAGAREPDPCVRGVSSAFLVGAVTGAVTGAGTGAGSGSVVTPVPDGVPGGYDACLLVHMTTSWGPRWECNSRTRFNQSRFTVRVEARPEHSQVVPCVTVTSAFYCGRPRGGS